MGITFLEVEVVNVTAPEAVERLTFLVGGFWWTQKPSTL